MIMAIMLNIPSLYMVFSTFLSRKIFNMWGIKRPSAIYIIRLESENVISLMLSGKRSFKDTHIITPDANDKDAWIILSFFLKNIRNEPNMVDSPAKKLKRKGI